MWGLFNNLGLFPWNLFLRGIFLRSLFTPSTVGFRPVISQKAKCEFITLKHDSMNVYINWIIFRQFWVHFLSKRVKKLIILQHFFSNLLSKITSLKCNTTLLYRKAKMLFGPYFQEKLGLLFALLCTKSQNLLKVWKLRQSLFPLAGFDPRSTAWQPGVLATRPPKLW